MSKDKRIHMYICVVTFVLLTNVFSAIQFSEPIIIEQTETDGANCVVAADLNNDGYPDILSSSSEDNKVSWFQNDGTGRFGEQTVLTTLADAPTCVSAADLDNDGDIDVISGSYGDNTIAWYQNDGSGNFGVQIVLSTSIDNPRAIVAEDLNGDGSLDLSVGSYDDSRVRWFKNDGNGNFSEPILISYSEKYCSDLFAADLDDDGDVDLMSAGDNAVAWFANDGEGNFSRTLLTGSAKYSSSVHAADLDRDGDLDVIAVGGGIDRISWFENDGAGNFSAPKIAISDVKSVNSIITADFDSDSDQDIVVALGMGFVNLNNCIVLYKNDGTGVFVDQEILKPRCVNPQSLFVSDLDNDGNVDIISASLGDDKISWYENTGEGHFDKQNVVTASADGAVQVRTADIDSDGDLDVLISTVYSDLIAWYANDGSGNFSQQKVIDVNFEAPWSIQATDLDSDNDLDVLFVDTPNNLIGWYENQGAGEFGEQHFIANQNGAFSVFTDDLDADGDQDVICASYSNDRVSRYENDGTGSFGIENRITIEADNVRSVFTADIDNDGDQDVISGSYNDGKVAWYQNDGFGDFGDQDIIFEIPDFPALPMVWSVYACDLDSDGDIDVLSANDHSVTWYKNDGAGNFIWGHNNSTITDQIDKGRWVFADDLDNDGDNDVLSVSVDDDKVAWYENAGNGTFGQQNIFSFGLDSPGCVYTGDLDGDGDQDVIVVSEHDSKVVWFKNIQPPEAFFSTDTTNGEIPCSIQFLDNSTGNMTDWFWDFGDGEVSSDQNPIHIYETEGTYAVSLTISGPDGSDTILKENFITVKSSSAGVTVTESLPDKFLLYQNFPNPFNPSTIISFDVKKACHVVLNIYNVSGQRIMTFIDSDKKPGSYQVEFDASKLQSGLYFYEIKMDNYRDLKKMILIH